MADWYCRWVCWPWWSGVLRSVRGRSGILSLSISGVYPISLSWPLVESLGRWWDSWYVGGCCKYRFFHGAVLSEAWLMHGAWVPLGTLTSIMIYWIYIPPLPELEGVFANGCGDVSDQYDSECSALYCKSGDTSAADKYYYERIWTCDTSKKLHLFSPNACNDFLVALLLDISQRTSWLTQGHNAQAIFDFYHSNATHGWECHRSPQDSTTSVVNFHWYTLHNTPPLSFNMQPSNKQPITIAWLTVGILWHHGPLGTWSDQPNHYSPPLSTYRWAVWVHLSISYLTSPFRNSITSTRLIPNLIRGGSQSGVDRWSNGKWFFTVHVRSPVLQLFHTCFQLVWSHCVHTTRQENK